MSKNIIIKKEKELKNIGGHKPFGVELDPNKELCLTEDKERGQKAYYKGEPIKYLDYFGEICDRGIKAKKGKNLDSKMFGGIGKGKLKKPYLENK